MLKINNSGYKYKNVNIVNNVTVTMLNNIYLRAIVYNACYCMHTNV